MVGPVSLVLTRVAKRRYQLTARRLAGGDVVAVDTLDLARAGQRQRFIEQVLEKLAPPRARGAGAGSTGWTRPCSQLASAPATPAASGLAVAPEAEFRVVEDAGDPELNGLYATTPPAQIGNFDMRILEHVVVERRGSPRRPGCGW